MQRLIVYLQIILILALVGAVAAPRSPEIGAIGLKDWTKDEDLRHPYGIGFYLFQPVSDKVKLTFEYDYLTSKTRDWVYQYSGHSQLSGCSAMEEVVRRNRVSLFQFGFRHLVARSRTTSLDFGGGVCFANVGAGEHSRQSGVHRDFANAYKMGLVIDVGLLVTELKDLPLVMRFGFRHRFLSGCGSARPCGWASSTFDDPITTTGLSWGLGYQFGR